MGEWNTGGWNSSLLNDRLVHIDESEEHLARTPMARYHMRGSLRAIFDRLIERMHESGQHTDPGVARRRAAVQAASMKWKPADMLEMPEAFHSDAVPIKPQRLMKELGGMFPRSTRFLADTGNSMAWATHYLQARDRRMGERRFGGGDRQRDLGKRQSTGGWLRLITHFAPMGWAIGAAIGTAAGNPDAPVVCITGDGAMLMSGQELSVAVAEQQCVIFVVLNDAALGMIKHGQRLARAERIGYGTASAWRAPSGSATRCRAPTSPPCRARRVAAATRSAPRPTCRRWTSSPFATTQARPCWTSTSIRKKCRR
jgi:acetolactate synthase I/II/III large subunit